MRMGIANTGTLKYAYHKSSMIARPDNTSTLIKFADKKPHAVANLKRSCRTFLRKKQMKT